MVGYGSDRLCLLAVEAEKLGPKAVFVDLLGRLCLFAGVFFGETGLFPLVEIGDGVLDRGEVFLVLDGLLPCIDGYFIGCLSLVEFYDSDFHVVHFAQTVPEPDEWAMYARLLQEVDPGVSRKMRSICGWLPRML